MAIPQPPRILYLLLKGARTFLRWAQVQVDINNAATMITAYNIYQGIDGSPENMELIATVGTVDIKGQVDTMWTGLYSGFSVFGVTAVNGSGESALASEAALPFPNDPDSLG